MESSSKSNLYTHPNLNRGQVAMMERLAVQLAKERRIAIAAIEQAIASLKEHQPKGPPGTAERLIEHFKSALIEIEAVKPATWPDPKQYEEIADRLATLIELPKAYLLLSKSGVLKKPTDM